MSRPVFCYVVLIWPIRSALLHFSYFSGSPAFFCSLGVPPCCFLHSLWQPFTRSMARMTTINLASMIEEPCDHLQSATQHNDIGFNNTLRLIVTRIPSYQGGGMCPLGTASPFTTLTFLAVPAISGRTLNFVQFVSCSMLYCPVCFSYTSILTSLSPPRLFI